MRPNGKASLHSVHSLPALFRSEATWFLMVLVWPSTCLETLRSIAKSLKWSQHPSIPRARRPASAARAERFDCKILQRSSNVCHCFHRFPRSSYMPANHCANSWILALATFMPIRAIIISLCSLFLPQCGACQVDGKS